MRTLFQQITDQIVGAIEAGAEDFVMPWHSGGSRLPTNAISGRAYAGINILMLWAQARACGYRSAQWATYRQWRSAGAQVRKGEQATLVMFWKSAGGGEGEGGTDASDDETKRPRFIARAFWVFNVEQVDGFAEALPTPLTEQDRIATAESFFSKVQATIWYGGGHAFYDFRADMISMPDIGAFKRPEGFYSVLAHELVHWSGANHRLGRDLKNRFGSEAYAAEELIAEMGAAFLGAHLGLDIDPRRDHAPYIASWLKILREDPRAIITAASKAQIAINYLLELADGASTARCDSTEHAA